MIYLRKIALLFLFVLSQFSESNADHYVGELEPIIDSSTGRTTSRPEPFEELEQKIDYSTDKSKFGPEESDHKMPFAGSKEEDGDLESDKPQLR